MEVDQVLSPFQGSQPYPISAQWLRTTLRSVLHHWLPYIAPLALDLWILQQPLENENESPQRTSSLYH